MILSLAIVRRDGGPSPLASKGASAEVRNSKILVAAYDLSSFNFFQRSTYAIFYNLIFDDSGQEFLAFFTRTIAERTERGVRQTVEEDRNQILMTLLI